MNKHTFGYNLICRQGGQGMMSPGVHGKFVSGSVDSLNHTGILEGSGSDNVCDGG
jgi:hypothetical protein